MNEVHGEIRYAASFVNWFSDEAPRIGTTIPSPTPGWRIVVLKEPVGVWAIITPWNFPAAMITRKVAPALAAGCTVAIKPSEFTPLSALALGVVAERAGIPAGVINIITGWPTEIGLELTTNPAVRKVSFTGSTRVGALLMRQASDTIKRLSLDLGGNAAFIAFDDADLNLAVERVMASKFRNGGQSCVCANHILVQAGIYDTFAEILAARVSDLKVGPGPVGDAVVEMSAIASGRAGANRSALQNGDTYTCLGKMQGRGQTGETAADDGDVIMSFGRPLLRSYEWRRGVVPVRLELHLAGS